MPTSTEIEIARVNEESRREYERKLRDRKARELQLAEDRKKGRKKYFFIKRK